MMPRLSTIAAGAFLLAGAAGRPAAAEVTFTRDVAPIVFAKCGSGHRPGEVAPMALRPYDEVRPFARAIRAAVESRSMPPWPADRTVGQFANDPSLTATEIETIAAWVEGGAVQGNPRDLPKP